MNTHHKNTPKENPLLEKYEYFLNHVSEVLDCDIPMDVRNKNRNLYHTFAKVSSSKDLVEELNKKYHIRGIYNGKTSNSALLHRKKEVLACKYYMFPKIREKGEGFNLTQLIFLERKDTFGSMKEKIKKKLGYLVPGGIFGIDNI